jgi:hypothetical protein
MDALFKKLNFKGHTHSCVLHAPAEFEEGIIWLAANSQLRPNPEGPAPLDFAMAFVITQAALDAAAAQLADNLASDGVLWLCYPKGSSKRYRCDFNRDTGWEVLGQLGFEPVRQVAIDDDWSALRFRRVQHIKTLTRSKEMALTSEGKERTRG